MEHVAAFTFSPTLELDFEMMIDHTGAIFLGKVETRHCQIFTFAIDFPALEYGHFSDGRSYVKSVLHHTICVVCGSLFIYTAILGKVHTHH